MQRVRVVNASNGVEAYLPLCQLQQVDSAHFQNLLEASSQEGPLEEVRLLHLPPITDSETLSTLLLGRNYVEQKTEVEIHENVDENDDSDSDEQSEVKDEDEKDDGCDASDQEEEIVAEGEKETDDCKSFKGIATMHFSVLYASDAPPEPGQMPDVIQTLRHKLLSLCWTHKLGLDKQAERHGRRFTQK